MDTNVSPINDLIKIHENWDFLRCGRSIDRKDPAKFFAVSNKVGTDGEAGGEYSLFEFNPCFATRERETFEDFKFRLYWSAVGWVESTNFRTFRMF